MEQIMASWTREFDQTYVPALFFGEDGFCYSILASPSAQILDHIP